MLSLKDIILVTCNYDFSKLEKYPLLLKSKFMDELGEEFNKKCNIRLSLKEIVYGQHIYIMLCVAN